MYRLLTASVLATFAILSSGAAAEPGASANTWSAPFTLGDLFDPWCSTLQSRAWGEANSWAQHRKCLEASQKVRSQFGTVANPQAASLGTASISHWKTTPKDKARAHVEATTEGIFSSVPLRIRALPAVKRLEPTYADIGRGDLFDCGTGLCSTARVTMSQVIKVVKPASFSGKLEVINRAVNRLVAYRSDNVNYGVRDYWAAPAEVLSRQIGDCEDFAILKMAALASAGIPLKSMSIVVLQDERRKLFHAVLSVRTSEGHFVLDNLDEAVLKDSEISTYTPLYSVSAGRGYIHGKQKGAPRTLARSFEIQSIAPGEGHSAVAEPAFVAR